MVPAPADELSESMSQIVGVWRVLATGIPQADVGDLPGMAFSWPDVPSSFLNAIWLTDMVADANDLDERVKRAAQYMSKKRYPGMLFVCSEYLAPALPARVDQLLARYQLFPTWTLTGMAADSLREPVHPLPQLEFRRVSGVDAYRDLIDVNSYAYGFPPEPGRQSLGDPQIWDQNAWGYMAMAGGRPVASSATFNLDGRIYVALVATLPDMQRRGYAEAVMRKSIAECKKDTGLTRTILHASEAGHPLYLRMGYRDRSRFVAYTPPMSGQ